MWPPGAEDTTRRPPEQFLLSSFATMWMRCDRQEPTPTYWPPEQFQPLKLASIVKTCGGWEPDRPHDGHRNNFNYELLAKWWSVTARSQGTTCRQQFPVQSEKKPHLHDSQNDMRTLCINRNIMEIFLSEINTYFTTFFYLVLVVGPNVLVHKLISPNLLVNWMISLQY